MRIPDLPGFVYRTLAGQTTMNFEKLWFRAHDMLWWLPLLKWWYLEYVPSELNLWVFIISKVSRSMKHTPPSLPPTMIRLFWWDIIKDAIPLLSSFNSNWVCGSIYCRVKRSQQLISVLNQHFQEPHGLLNQAGTDGPMVLVNHYYKVSNRWNSINPYGFTVWETFRAVPESFFLRVLLISGC